ncbi:hypothetical protein C8J57DRAFT_1317754 [Mycena rebaudengoi]|nr:hypothetical protein C8J57DRAFT_1317754 [Mycena rebaudengoi]
MMASTDGEDVSPESPPNESPSPPMTMHMYPFNPNSDSGVRTKRRQVKNACTNCQRSSKRCDEARPCLRCVKYGISEACVDSIRRERRKGKRGPYRKKRNGLDPDVAQVADASQAGENASSPSASGSSGGSFVGAVPIGYPPEVYPHYPPPPGYKHGEPSTYYPQFYLAPVPSNAGQEGDGAGAYSPPPQLFPATFPYARAYPQYIMHTRSDGQLVPHYPAFVAPVPANTHEQPQHEAALQRASPKE